MKCLLTTHLSLKQIPQVLCQRTLIEKLTNICCGDENAMIGTKHIDPALCLYLGAYLMCIDNKHLTDKVPWGNGTLCWVLDVKLKQNVPSYKYKNYYGRKVWTVNATDVEWVECEHVNKTGLMVQLETQIHDVTSKLNLATKKTQPHKHLRSNIEQLKNRLSTKMSNRKFKLEPEQCSPKISIENYHAEITARSGLVIVVSLHRIGARGAGDVTRAPYWGPRGARCNWFL
jgi:hypothetical protein